MIAHRTLGLWAGVLALVACTKTRPEGVDVASLPAGVRADYEVFAQRCSKCHSLARPLGSQIQDDAHWERYFERMRLTPGSGLTVQDKGPILRFLHYYSAEQKRRKAEADAPSAPPATSAAPVTPDAGTMGADDGGRE